MPRKAGSKTAREGMSQGRGPRPGRGRYGALLEKLSIGSFDMDMDGTITFANRALERIFHLSTGQVAGKNSRDLTASESGGAFSKVVRRILNTGESNMGEIADVVLRDGAKATLEISAVLEEGKNGSPPFIRGLVREVSERVEEWRMVLNTLQSFPFAIALLDGNGDVRVVNDAWRSKIPSRRGVKARRPGDDYLKMLNRLARTGDEGAAREAESIRAVINGQRVACSLEYNATLGGEKRWIHEMINACPPGGAYREVLLVRRDITEHRAAEEEVEALYKSIDSMVDGMALMNMELGLLYANPAFASAHGYDAPADVIDKSYLDLFPKNQRKKITSEVFPRVRKLGYWSGETRGLRSNNTDFPEELSLTFIKESGLVVCSLRDITERKRTESLLEKSDVRFRHIVENTPDFYFYVHDQNGRYTYISPSAEAVTGYPPSYFTAPHETLLTDALINRKALEICRSVMEHGIIPPPYCLEIRHRDGHLMVIETFEKPIMRDGKLVEVIGLCHDVTKRLKTQKQVLT